MFRVSLIGLPCTYRIVFLIRLMPARSWIAILLLINYLLVVGAGCVNHPQDQHELVMVQTHAADYPYQQCRYLRMDGLESFLTEALASRYQNAPDTPQHHLLTVVGGIDAHSLFFTTWLFPIAGFQPVVAIRRRQSMRLLGVYHALNAPPWRG